MAKNNRTIPTTKNFEGDKAMSDKIYMYLQSISKRNASQDHRYISLEEVNMSKVATTLGIGRATLYRKLDALESGEFIDRSSEGYIILPLVEKYELIPQDTLEYFFNNGFNDNIFKIFAWFCNRDKIQKGNICFTQNFMLSEVLGENNTSAAARNKFHDNMDLLHRLGLIRVVVENTPKGNTVYKAIAVSKNIGGLDHMNNKSLFSRAAKGK